LSSPWVQGSLSYGSAIILGTPPHLSLQFRRVQRYHRGSGVKPHFPSGRLLAPFAYRAIEVSEYEGSYMSFLRGVLVPGLFMGSEPGSSGSFAPIRRAWWPLRPLPRRLCSAVTLRVSRGPMWILRYIFSIPEFPEGPRFFSEERTLRARHHAGGLRGHGKHRGQQGAHVYHPMRI